MIWKTGKQSIVIWTDREKEVALEASKAEQQEHRLLKDTLVFDESAARLFSECDECHRHVPAIRWRIYAILSSRGEKLQEQKAERSIVRPKFYADPLQLCLLLGWLPVPSSAIQRSTCKSPLASCSGL